MSSYTTFISTGYGLFGSTIVTDKKQKECEETGQVCEPELFVTHSSTAPENPFNPYFRWRTEGGLHALMQLVLCRVRQGPHSKQEVKSTDSNMTL